jgi:hypothetical protein
MPKPFYMLCSQTGSIDKDSGLISHFNVIEKLHLMIPRAGEKAGSVALLPMMICATWTREDKDKETDEFEFEMAFKLSDLPETVMHKGLFKFEKEHYRILVMGQFSLPEEKPKSGFWNFESRVRKSGVKTWLRQNFQIPVEVTEAPHSTHTRNGKKKKRR